MPCQWSDNFKMVFGVFDFLQKTNERIRLYSYDTSNRLVFVRFLEEIEGTKKPFRNYLTFSVKLQLQSLHLYIYYFVYKLNNFIKIVEKFGT